MLTEADDDVPGVVGHAREEDERAADADDAHEAEHRDAQEQRERDLERVVRLVQRAPVLVEHPADVDWMGIASSRARYSVSGQHAVRAERARRRERDLRSNPTMIRRMLTTIAAVMVPLGGLNWISVRQGESREGGYDLLTVCPSRLCSRRSGRRARRRWDGSFRSSVGALALAQRRGG